MIKALTARPPPLHEDEDGVVRVGGTRVQLASVLIPFNQGRGAEDIQRMYPSLELTDVYATITYYLWHRAELDEYLREYDRQAADSRAETEKRFPSAGLRERLLARPKGRDGNTP
jgi:uncharacterized protein (DUF433 family)